MKITHATMGYLFTIFKFLTKKYDKNIINNIYNQSRCLSSNKLVFYKDAGNPLIPKTNTQDLLMYDLKTASNSESILDIVGAHHKIMNNQHIMQALRSLFNLHKGGKSQLTTSEMLKHPDFIQLCKHLKKYSREIEINEIIEALKVMSFVGVPSDSTITQVLLQLIRHNINYLSLHHIIFLEFLLKQFSSSPLVEALKIALPLVFDINLKLKMDRENVVHLSDLLFYASKNEISQASIDEIIFCLLKQKHSMNMKTAKSVVWSLCDLKPNEIFEPLLNYSLNILSDEIDKLSITGIETTLSKLARRYSRSDEFYYHEQFCDKAVDFIIDNNVGFEKAAWILIKLNKFNHLSVPLLKYIESTLSDPNNLINGKPIIIFSIMSSLATIGQTDIINWKSIVDMILKNSIFKDNSYDQRWIQFAAELVSLNVYSEIVLQNAFKEEHISRLVNKDYYDQDCNNILLLSQAVSTEKQDMKYLLPSSEIIQSLLEKKSSSIRDNPLKPALERALGGPAYVKTKLYTKMGHYIDHVIIMRKGGFPIAFKKDGVDVKYLEDLKDVYGIDTNIIAILVFPPNYYISNTHKLQGIYQITVRTLEAQNVSVIPVSLMQWYELLDHEKIPYLMQVIRVMTNHLESLKSVN